MGVQALPLDQLSATVQVGNEKIGKMSLPPGSYVNADRRIMVFNYFGGPPNPAAEGVIGGVTDMLAQNAKAAKKFAPTISAVTFDLAVPTQAAIAKYSPVLEGHATRSDTTLSISPFAYFIQEKPGEFRIRVLLQGTLTTQKGKKLWTNRYYCPSADLHPLEGDENWLAGNRYELAATEAIDRTMPFVFKDVLGELKPGREVRVETGVTWNAQIEYPAKVLDESGDWLAVRHFRDGNLGDDVDLVDKRNARIEPAEDGSGSVTRDTGASRGANRRNRGCSSR